MPTRHRGTAEEVRALDAFIKLMRASETLAAKLGKTLHEMGFTYGQLSVLEALHHLGPMNARDLSAKVLRTSANMTTVLDNLERAGLVTRERVREDRRFVRVALTAAGAEKIAAIFPRHAAHITEALSVLTPAEQAELGRLCRKLGLASAPSRDEEERA